jgi:hypothetical protein
MNSMADFTTITLKTSDAVFLHSFLDEPGELPKQMIDFLELLWTAIKHQNHVALPVVKR